VKTLLLEIKKQPDGTFCVKLSDEISVGGFSSEMVAGIWLIHYMGAAHEAGSKLDLQKSLAGAVLLENLKGPKQ
jgi:hypothetical protein